MKNLKKILALVLIMALSFSFAACGTSNEQQVVETSSQTTENSAEEQPAEEPQELQKVRLGYMPNLISASLSAVGKYEGFFEEFGLDAELVKFTSGPPEIAALVAGDLDAAFIGHGAHLLAVQGEAELIYLELLGDADQVYALKSAGIETTEDLKGKTIAVVKGTSSEALVNLTLEQGGLTADDVELVNMDQNGVAAAMISGQVDAAGVWSPQSSIIMEEVGEENIVVLSTISDFADSTPNPGSWVVSQKTIDENPELVLNLVKALMKASDFRANDIMRTAEHVATLINADPEDVKIEADVASWFTAEEIYNYAQDGTFETWYTVQQQMFIDAGQLEETVALDTYYTNSFIIQAYEELYK